MMMLLSAGGPTVPGAPTIGTATATGATTATVSFTAPASDGGSAITSYTATSSPGGITGTLNQSGSGTITVNGLTGGTSYTFTVTATNAVGTSAPSASSNSVTTSLVIGQAYGGGYFGGKVNIGGTVYNLIVADKTVGETLGQVWGPYGVTTGITSVINGSSNSASLSGFGSSYQAARFCENLNTGGYTDWYLPAKNELEVLYYFLKPSISTNSGYNNSGSNANAVSPEPVNTPYDSTSYPAQSPAQTSATNFRSGASSQEFTTGTYEIYWTSTEPTNVDISAGNAFTQRFGSGRQDYNAKDDTNIKTRAVRKVVA